MRYVDTAAAEGPSVLIPRKGSLGNIFYVEAESVKAGETDSVRRSV